MLKINEINAIKANSWNKKNFMKIHEIKKINEIKANSHIKNSISQ